MNATEVTGFVVALLVMLLGFAGSLLPVLPGPPLIFLAALIHRLIFTDKGASIWVLVTLGTLTAVSFFLDFLASVYGAKRLGATWRGLLGAFIGGLIGLFTSPLGLLLGPLLGAVLGELLGGRKWLEAGKAGLGAILGILVGTAGKVACALGMIGLWTLHILLSTLR